MSSRLVIGVACVLVVAVTGWLGTIIADDASKLRSIDALIGEHERIRENVKLERKKYQEEIDRTKRELAAAPDSLKKVRTAFLMEKSLAFAKTESALDENDLRASKRLDFQRAKRAEVEDHLTRRIVMLAFVDVAIAAGGLAVASRVKRRRHGS